MRKNKTRHIPSTPKLDTLVQRQPFVLKGKVHKLRKSRTGRPRVVTQEVVRKLEHAIAYDCTIKEACVYAGISRDTFYSFCKEYPTFSDRITELRNMSMILVRMTLVCGAISDPHMAMKYAERKRPQEFSLKFVVNHQPAEQPIPRDESEQAIAVFKRFELQAKKSKH